MELSFPISLVVFDYGNVIARVDHARFFRRLTGASPEVAGDMVRRFYGQESIGADYESGRLSFGQFHSHLVHAVNEYVQTLPTSQRDQIKLGPWPEDAFLDAFCDMFEPLETTWRLMHDLKPRYRIGLLSNTNAVHYEHVISRIPVYPLFDQITMSWQVGCMKPDPRIFADVLQKFGGPPREILYLDDIPRYVAAARDEGFQAIMFDPNRAERQVDELRRLLLPV